MHPLVDQRPKPFGIEKVLHTQLYFVEMHSARTASGSKSAPSGQCGDDSLLLVVQFTGQAGTASSRSPIRSSSDETVSRVRSLRALLRQC